MVFLSVHDQAASALVCHQRVPYIHTRSPSYVLPCGIHLGVASIAPKLNSLHEHQVMLLYICKHLVSGKLQELERLLESIYTILCVYILVCAPILKVNSKDFTH